MDFLASIVIGFFIPAILGVAVGLMRRAWRWAGKDLDEN